ncbi:MAG: hypothetical protein IJ272_07780 [Clostridia bacterium]|nr:hypothetical protein [Clostridia bacterium]
MDKLKELFNKDKKTSNLILIVILLVIVLIFANYIFNSEENNNSTTSVLSENVIDTPDSVETRLANIISKIAGVETANVMISYSSTEKIIPVYDTKENIDTTTQEDKTSSKKTVEKTVAYEGEGSSKNALLESKETAEATGAIVVVNGTISDNVKLEIKEAVAMVTNVPLHKVQIFVN